MTRTNRKSQNAALTVIAGCLSLLVVGQFTTGTSALSTAEAQVIHTRSGPEEPRSGGMVSAADQRKIMIADLKNMSARLERIEGVLARGLSVKVTEMPPIQLPKEPRERKEAETPDESR